MTLSDKATRVYEAMKALQDERQLGPTLEEIGARAGLKHRGSVLFQIVKLMSVDLVKDTGADSHKYVAVEPASE